MKKIIYIGFAFKHHLGTQAGYNHIRDYINYNKIIDCQREFEWLNNPLNSFVSKLFRKIYRILLGSGCPLAVIKCILLAVFKKNQVFHFIYSENSYKWLHHFKGKTNKIVCTYHQPSYIFELNPQWKSNLKYIDKVILMTQKDIVQFKQLTEKDNIYFIPHGINTDFYSPDFNTVRKCNILMVGDWLRDFEFANVIFEALLSKCQGLSITIVTNSKNYSFFKLYERLQLLSGISDEQLRDLYRTSKCLFLPLESFTANNAILEAAAMGCPIVIATNNIDTSYLNSDQIDFLPLHYETVLNFLTSLINKEIDLPRAKRTHEYILQNYSWEVIAKKTNELLNNW